MTKTEKLKKDAEDIQTVKTALRGAGVRKEFTDRYIALIARLQQDNVLPAEVLSIGAELIAMQPELDRCYRQSRRRDIVGEMADSILRVERIA